MEVSRDLNSTKLPANIPRGQKGRRRREMPRTLSTQLLHPLALVLLLIFLALSSRHLATFGQSQQNGGPPSNEDEFGASSLGQQRQRNEFRAGRALGLVRDWALRFGREIHQGTQEATCQRVIRSQFDPAKLDRSKRGPYRASVVSIDWTRLHAETVRTISTAMGWHENAVRAIVEASESLAANHTYDENLPNPEYVDVHRLHDIDEMLIDEQDLDSDGQSGPGSSQQQQQSGQFPQEPAGSSTATPPAHDVSPSVDLDPDQILADQQPRVERDDGPQAQALVMQPAGTPMPQDEAQGEWQTPIKYAKLSRHPNFGDLLINTEMSAVHVPVHIYPGQPAVKNAIAWSEELTRVFKNNLVQNPRLTNQYFASPHGFMRLFPAQKWPIPRNDPDLYDARMRPWYVAGASSRKDVVILVDASGSMTGSRRDIAKGVVFEILDTLTDNDHFVVLRFNDAVQQIGVPACAKMRSQRAKPKIPLKNTISLAPERGDGSTSSTEAADQLIGGGQVGANGTDLDSLYLLPATGRNVRYLKTNFTISTSGIANFSHALVTAFEVLQKYQDSESRGSQCNQAIMLITDGSPSDFERIFNRYNYPNAPVRVFTYLIGRETGDGTHTKMMACHNRGFYTHVINLAEVRETVQQYINVMARPLVLNRTHPTTWTPAYGELTYQMLTDWIWESRRRERARAIVAANQRVSGSKGNSATIRVSNENLDVAPPSGQSQDGLDDESPDDAQASSASNGGNFQLEDEAAELEALDLFGYETNPDCFWELHRNDLTTTVVQPVYDQRNDSLVVEKYLNKNTWVRREQRMRTANLLGVAGVDLKINDIIQLVANSFKLGPNGYPIMLTNNGIVMHHPDLRSILEPLTNDPSERNSRILKPFFSSLDLMQIEHILRANSSQVSSSQDDEHFLALRNEAVDGKTGWRELATKRTIDCQRRVQTRLQSFYYKPIEQFPFVFLHSIPQPYGSYRLEAQVEVKSPNLPEKLTTYFTTSDYDLWSVHPDYNYCEGPANNTITTLLDMFQRIEEGKLNDIEWYPAESSKAPILMPDKIYCDKELVQSLVYDAVATFSFSEDCGPPGSARDADDPLSLLLSLLPRSSLMGMFGVRFSFVATRSGLTRVRHQSADDLVMKREALAFAKRHARATDETYYKRTVDYNMLMNETATLLQVPFNTHQKIRDRLSKLELDPSGQSVSGYGNEETLATNYDEAATGGSGYSGRLQLKEMDLYEKLEFLANSSLHVIATESLVVNEGAQRAVAGVSGVFYDYATFVMRFLNSTNAKFSGSSEARASFKKPARCYLNPVPSDEICDEDELNGSLEQIRCGLQNDTIDCLLIDNNGYILVSERLEFVGRHLRAYEQAIMQSLVASGVFHEVNITDHQSICVKQEEKLSSGSSSSASSLPLAKVGHLFASSAGSMLANVLALLTYTCTTLITISGLLADLGQAALLNWPPPASSSLLATSQQQQQNFQALSAMLPKKSYLRPCDRILTRYETRPKSPTGSNKAEHFTSKCSQCPGWFVYEQVAKTNLIMLIVDRGSQAPSCVAAKCEGSSKLDSLAVEPAAASEEDDSLMTQSNIIGQDENQVCAMFERDSKLHRKRLDFCISHHHDEEQIKLCGSADGLTGPWTKRPLESVLLSLSLFLLSRLIMFNWRAFSVANN